jgi:hypothetical protein
VFSSSHTAPGLSFPAALRWNTQQHQQSQPPRLAQACPPQWKNECPASLEAKPASTMPVSSGSM